jgi:hypothetical protein
MEIIEIIYNKMEEHGYERDPQMNKAIETRYNRMKKNKRGKAFTDEALVEYILRMFYQKKKPVMRCKYFIGDKTITDYANDEGVSANGLRSAIYSGRNKGIPVEEIGKDFVERANQRSDIPNGPLLKECRKLGMTYAQIVEIFNDEYPDSESMTEEEKDAALAEIMTTMIEAKKPKERKMAIILQ